MILSYKFQLLPSKSQEIQLDKFLNIGKNFWNYVLDLDQEHYKNKKDDEKTYSDYDLHKFINNFKDQNKDLTKLHMHLYQEICTRYVYARSNAIKKYKSGLSNHLELPKIKEESLKSLKFKQYNNGCKIQGNKVIFNKLTLKFRKHIEIEGDIKTIQIKKVYKNKYELIVTCCVNKEFISKYSELKENIRFIKDNRAIKDTKVIGIDLGLEKLVTLSTGKVYENPRHIKKYEKRLEELKEIMNSRKKDSKRYEKARMLFQKKHEKIKNSRDNYLHKVSKEIVLTCGTTLVAEKLEVKKMLESTKIYNPVKKSIADASWARLFFFLDYKCNKYGKTFIQLNPAYSSQECYNCGNIKEKKLSERVHNCEKCGERGLDRDLNSALVLRKRYLGINNTKARNVPSFNHENPIPCEAWGG